MTVDTEARSKLAEATRWLIGGRITNYEFDDRISSLLDPTVQEIYSQYLWLLYCDMREYRLVGADKLESRERDRVVRCIFFLKSGPPYPWPVLSRAASVLLTIFKLLTLGMAGRVYFWHVCAAGDMSYWPFLSATQYAQALEVPAYLAGEGANNSLLQVPAGAPEF